MKIALVTGASSGIGREFAEQLITSGMADKVYAVARRLNRLEDLAEKYPEKIVPIAADLSEQSAFTNISDKLKQDGVKISILVGAAGFGKYGSFANNSEEDMEAEVNVNVIGLMRTVRVALDFMDKGSKIIIMGSQSSFQPLPEFNIYASTKAFVLHFGRALNVELKSKGISVTTVCPGYVATEFFEVAEKSGDPKACQNFSPMYLASDVVRKALKDSKKGRDVSIYGFNVKASRLASKLLPHKLVMKVWLKIK